MDPSALSATKPVSKHGKSVPTSPNFFKSSTKKLANPDFLVTFNSASSAAPPAIKSAADSAAEAQLGGSVDKSDEPLKDLFDSVTDFLHSLFSW